MRLLKVGNSDRKDDLEGFFENRMIEKNVFSVTSSNKERCVKLIQEAEDKSIVFLHRNLGGDGSGIIAVSTIVGQPSEPILVKGFWLSEVKVEPWIVLHEPIPHWEIEKKVGRLSIRIQHTVNSIDDVTFANGLLDLFFEKWRQ
jgi:hypothetical protein